MTDLASTIARLRELLAKATPGPWSATRYRFGEAEIEAGQPGTLRSLGRMNGSDGADEPADLAGHDNAELIAALRNAAPALLDAAERAEQANGRQLDVELASVRRSLNEALDERDRLAARVKELEAESEHRARSLRAFAELREYVDEVAARPEAK